MARLDPHSYADDAQPVVHHLDWVARVDFTSQVVTAEVVLRFAEPAAAAGPLDLDTRDLAIETVETEDGSPLAHSLAPAEPILGARLRVQVPAGAEAVRVRYRTAPGASALQWLGPEQTGAGTAPGLPFLYSQCQAIHARSVVPLQDTPGRRITYTAELSVPARLRGLMAAEWAARETRADDGPAVERFRMPQPIAPYLFAFAVGDLEARDLGPRSRVWASLSLVEAAAWELAGTEAMLAAGEALFGAYDWGRYDLLVLPPAFPYGGMENPRLTFLTPTMIAGDRSLVSLVAHELAHAWTGNLVSNATAEHFWLNEGFTTYAERRIVEALSGPDAAALEWALGRRALDEAVERFAREGQPELTRLRTRLDGVDPDAASSVVPYEKGALLLRALEDALGRPTFDAFLRRYLDAFRFQALTTEEWVAFAERELPAGALERVGAAAWLHQPGVPPNAPRVASARLERIEALGAAGTLPAPDEAGAWRAQEWQLYVESLPRSVPLESLAELDRRYRFTDSGNYDLLVAWLEVALQAGYGPARPRAEAVLASVGRGKYLRPLYRALVERPETRALAHDLFTRFAPRYHPIARQIVQRILDQPPA